MPDTPPSSAPKIGDYLGEKEGSEDDFKQAVQNTTENLTELRQRIEANPEKEKLSDQEKTNLTEAVDAVEAINNIELQKRNDQKLVELNGRLDRIRRMFSLASPKPPAPAEGDTPPSSNAPPAAGQKPAEQTPEAKKALAEKLKQGKGLTNQVEAFVIKPLLTLSKSFGLGRFTRGMDIEKMVWTAVRDLNLPFLNIPFVGPKLKEEAAARVEIAEKKAAIMDKVNQVQKDFPRISLSDEAELLTTNVSQISVEDVRDAAVRAKKASPSANTLNISVAKLRDIDAVRTQETLVAQAQQEKVEEQTLAQVREQIVEGFGFSAEQLQSGQVKLEQNSKPSVTTGNPTVIALTSLETVPSGGPDGALLRAFGKMKNVAKIEISDEDNAKPSLKRSGAGIIARIPTTGINDEAAESLNLIAQKMPAGVEKVDYSERVAPADSRIRFHKDGTLVLSGGPETLATIAKEGLPDDKLNALSKDQDFVFSKGKWTEPSSLA